MGPFLERHCYDCHGPDLQEAGIRVDQLGSNQDLLENRKTWERVYRMINSGIMPPGDYDPLPAESEKTEVTDFLHQQLFEFDCNAIDNPGRSTVQRLNKTEYNNTIRDLFGIDIRPAEEFPADDVGEGFDNIGDVLSLPPLLMEKYLAAAEQVANAVVAQGSSRGRVQLSVQSEKLKATQKNARLDNGYRLLSNNGEIFTSFDLPADGEYQILVGAAADQAGPDRAKFALKVDGTVVVEKSIRSHRKPETFNVKTKIKAGSRRIAVEFLNDFYDNKAKGRKDRNLGVREIAIRGPIPDRSRDRNSPNGFITSRPSRRVSVEAAAEKVLIPLLPRAFRRPVPNDEVRRYAGLVKHAVDDLKVTYEDGLSLALQAILVAPDFLFRLENGPQQGQSDYQLNDHEIAVRLSYFLWSSMPDEELFRLAQSGRLHHRTTLRTQIKRMLQDEKSDALTQNFAAQWLNLRTLDSVQPSRKVFKNYSSELRDDMRRETEMLFTSIMREDRSVQDLLLADYTFVNKRLAELYGISGVNGDKFERVSLQGTDRTGVLTHASILTLTSHSRRTSPVKRGKWILENIFGDAPPPPPPNVPELEETADANPNATLREQLAQHRADPGCAACHKVMDPLGLGLENFNAIGEWRDKEDGHTIDASGSLPSGEAFNGPNELIEIVAGRREKFLRTLADKMLVYAIGRGTEYYDKCTIDECMKLLETRGYRFSALVEGIVLSKPFLKRSGPPLSDPL